MMHLCTFYTKEYVGRHVTVGSEVVTMCTECATICQPDHEYPTTRRSICVRCGIKNFYVGRVSNE